MDEVLASNHFIMGPQVAAFEKQVAEYLGVKHAVASPAAPTRWSPP